MQQEHHSVKGRRPGQNNTREAILVAAQQVFADKGFDRATLRTISQVANVDPALILYYFKNKQQLFIESVMPTYNPMAGIALALQGDKATIGKRYAAFMVTFLDDPHHGMVAQGLIRAAAAEPAVSILRDSIETQLAKLITTIIAWPDAEFRANLVCSIYVGFVMMRYIIKLQPLATATSDEAIDYLAPLLQQCLGEPF